MGSDDDQLKQWISRNKKQIAREFIRKTDHVGSENPVAIITAGLPGAGKTEFTKELLKQIDTKPLRIDMDEIAALIEGYRPQIADKFRAGASAILNRIYDEVLKKRIDFILDGTFAGSSAINNVQRAIDHGYTLKIYFIHQQPLRAWEFTKAREKVEYRSINQEKFVQTYTNIYSNIRELRNFTDRVSVTVIIKTDDNKEGTRIENVKDILQVIPSELSRIEIEGMLK